ncbi:maleylacetate reductase [Actinomadura meridiana]|uniref:Maleylacetate reductase n=1 Tax=Actinomadura meridiana TaxID=559626 RepID=A0ABP8C5W8_9ACTN
MGTTETDPSVTVNETLASRVLIGRGAVGQVADEAARLDARRVLLVSTPSAATAADRVSAALGARLAGRFGRPVKHVPVEVTAEAMTLVEDTGADCVIEIGGGSAIGLGKAVARRTGMPQIAVPTTYSGSETTAVVGETENGVKTTHHALAVAPGTIVYDPDLTLTMPPGLTRTSAVNSLAHAVEALWSPDATMLSDALATESAAGILTALPEVLADPTGPDGRARLLSAAWLSGLCLSKIRTGLHHQLAHVLGGAYDLPHAELHTLLLPHVMRFNLPSAPAAASRLARVTGGDPTETVAALARAHDGPTRLSDLGVPRAELRDVAERVVAAPYPNPRQPTVDAVTELLNEAW